MKALTRTITVPSLGVWNARTGVGLGGPRKQNILSELSLVSSNFLRSRPFSLSLSLSSADRSDIGAETGSGSHPTDPPHFLLPFAPIPLFRPQTSKSFVLFSAELE